MKYPLTEASEFIEKWSPRIEAEIAHLLPPEAPGSPLTEAMRYSVLAGGKRLRPILVLASYRTCGGRSCSLALAPAVAIEFLHTYSLIHDDLPAMDDDDLRRGIPTCHRVYGEAMAILAGDALQTLGGEILAAYPKGERYAVSRAEVALKVFSALGWKGMAGGQALDLAAEGSGSSAALKDLITIHSLKTGALIKASLQVGAILSGAQKDHMRALDEYGECIGLAFQIVDDVLDITSSTKSLGKTAGKDIAQGKLTFPSLLGIDGSKNEANRLLEKAIAQLQMFGKMGNLLKSLAFSLVERAK